MALRTIIAQDIWLKVNTTQLILSPLHGMADRIEYHKLIIATLDLQSTYISTVPSLHLPLLILRLRQTKKKEKKREKKKRSWRVQHRRQGIWYTCSAQKCLYMCGVPMYSIENTQIFVASHPLDKKNSAPANLSHFPATGGDMMFPVCRLPSITTIHNSIQR